MSDILNYIRNRDPREHEFQQAVAEVVQAVQPVLERYPDYDRAAVLERLTEPDRVIMFRVPWMDDQGQVQVNRGYRVEMSNVIGPYRGGLRFHPSVNLGILKFLAFEQVFKNALSTLSLGGAQGGADFEPKGKSDGEIMRFCQSYMTELFRHIGPHTDIPAADMGVGAREIGYLFGMYKKLRNEFSGILTGKSLGWGGSLVRPEATGYGIVYFAEAMLARQQDSLAGKACLISGSGNVALHTAEKLLDSGARVLTVSDSSGYVFDAEGLDAGKLNYLKQLKLVRRGRLEEYGTKYPQAVYTSVVNTSEGYPLWQHPADCVFPCASQNDICGADATTLLQNGVQLIVEGANMPCTPEAVAQIMDRGILYAPGKAANVGSMVVSGLEIIQNSMRLTWTREEVEQRLRLIMQNIHDTCLQTADEYNAPGNYVIGANIAGFVKVVNAMLDQGVV